MSTISVLDKGSVTLVDHMGSDLTVVNAARVSNEKRVDEFVDEAHPRFRELRLDKGMRCDRKLISFLARNEHWTPFGHPQLQFHMKMPIFCARQFMRSNVGIVYNEVSRRYIDSPPEFYEPSEWRARPVGSVKQGSGASLEYIPESFSWADDCLGGDAEDACLVEYEKRLAAGVAPEMARMVLPQSTYTEFYATFSLAALARVVKLRQDSHAQWEIQEYARALSKLAEPLFPVSWKALTEAPACPPSQ